MLHWIALFTSGKGYRAVRGRLSGLPDGLRLELVMIDTLPKALAAFLIGLVVVGSIFAALV